MNSDYLKTWIAKADNDLMIINHELQLPEPEWVTDMICFHCRQAAEKYLKALLIYQDKEIPRTHNIEFLLTLIKESYPEISGLDVRDISQFGVDVRYPDDFYTPTIDEVKFYSTLVINIKTLVLKAISSKIIKPE